MGPRSRHRSGIRHPWFVVGNTWQAALDRLLIGSAVTDVDLDLAIGDVAPFGVDSGDVEILGHVRLHPRTAGHPGRVLGPVRSPVDGLGRCPPTVVRRPVRPPDQRAWQFESLERVLREIVEAAASSRRGAASELDLLDVRRLLEGRLDSEPGRPDFFRGGVTVTSMASLRWVPFRVVCVLGLDQDSLGSSAPDAADLVAAGPQVGDPDQRSETRQWLLEAVLAAGDHLVIVRDGRDIRSNHSMPQVVPAAELFDAVVALVPMDDRGAARVPRGGPSPPSVRRDVPDRRAASSSDVPWSFAAPGSRRGGPAPDRCAGAGILPRGATRHRSRAGGRTGRSPPVPPGPGRHLRASVPRGHSSPAGRRGRRHPPGGPGGLEIYRIGQDLLEARRPRDRGRDLAQRSSGPRGALPPGVLEDRLFDNAVRRDRRHAGRGRRPAACSWADPPDPRGRRRPARRRPGSSGRSRSVSTRPRPGPGRIQFTRPKETHRLEAWLDLMVLVASDPAVRWRSVVVTRAKAKGTRAEAGRARCRRRCDDPAAMALGALLSIVSTSIRQGTARTAPALQPATRPPCTPEPRRTIGLDGPPRKGGRGPSGGAAGLRRRRRGRDRRPAAAGRRPGCPGRRVELLRPPPVGHRRPHQRAVA